MSESQVESERVPAPKVTIVRMPRRKPDAPLVVTITTAAPAVEIPEAPPAQTDPAATSGTGAPDAPAAELAQQPVPEAEAPPAPTRRGRRGPKANTAITLDLALPGVRTAEILAELARRQRRASALLAERERVIREMDEIEAALETIG